MRVPAAPHPKGTSALWPYLVLSAAPLCWAGNIVPPRGVGDLIPPVAFAFWRWTLAFVQGDLLMAIAVVFYGLAARRADPALSHWRDGTPWSPDGKSIAFEAAQTQLLEDPFAGRNIYLADVNGSGKLRKLTNWEAGTGVGCFGAEWLPDGRRILAYCRSLMQAGVVLFDLRDPNFGEIMFEGQDARLYDASHSGKLAFSEGAYSMINWGANFSETAMINEQLPQPSHQKHGGIDALAWSPTADQLAIRAFDELFVTNQDGSQMDQLVSGLPSARPADLGWSSDGSQILFTATLDGNQEIMLSAPGQKGAIRRRFPRRTNRRLSGNHEE